ncbi:MAG: DNA (cytosine-5-)-methyltransferase [Parachlamydiaceae bacterium]
MKFKLGELFCGPGGMALGAKLAEDQVSSQGEFFSISHVWGVDHDSNAIETYNANALGEGIQCDAMAFAESHSACRHKTIADFTPITALAFGFPCNDFSMVGKRRGTDGAFGNLYKAGIAAINCTNPQWFIAENVSGIHSANAGEAFRQILLELKVAGKYGYDLTVNLYKFEDYGMPQYRHRYIIIGTRKDLQITFRVPAPTHLHNHISVRTALSRPYQEGVLNQELTRQSSRVVERLRFIPPWYNAWFLDDLYNMSPDKRKKVIDALPWKSEFGGVQDYMLKMRIDECRLQCVAARMSHIYRRLHPEKPSYTITGSGGGGTHVYHWHEHRALTNRERARLQGFPDNFEFKGEKEQVRKQIGMAVPPEGAKIIFEAIMKSFAGVEYVSVEPSIM